MKAVLCKAHGGPETLVVEEVPVPEPGPGEVLLRVSAVGLNFFDTLIIRDRYQYKPALPFSPGGECAGTVAALGEGVTGWEIGRRVAVYCGWGAAREMVVVPAERLVAVPDALSDEAAAGLCITYGTGLHALQDRARIRPGETLAVLGAAGGAGLAAVEIGRRLGARVIACASSAEKLALARAAGAEMEVNYAETPLREALRALAPDGIDVIYDPVGGDLAEPALRSMAWGGRYLVVGFAGGEIPRFPLNVIMLKGCDVLGVFWGGSVERDPAGHRANMATLMGWAATGDLSAHLDGVYPLADVTPALERIAGRKAQGKVILRP